MRQHGKQNNKELAFLCSLCFSRCLEPWLPSVMNCFLEWKKRNKPFPSPNCFGHSVDYSNRKLTRTQSKFFSSSSLPDRDSQLICTRCPVVPTAWKNFPCYHKNTHTQTHTTCSLVEFKDLFMKILIEDLM